jgi:hypothetical protein
LGRSAWGRHGNDDGSLAALGENHSRLWLELEERGTETDHRKRTKERLPGFRISFCKIYRPWTKWMKFGFSEEFRKISNEIDKPKFELWDENWPKMERKLNKICPHF